MRWMGPPVCPLVLILPITPVHGGCLLGRDPIWAWDSGSEFPFTDGDTGPREAEDVV